MVVLQVSHQGCFNMFPESRSLYNRWDNTAYYQRRAWPQRNNSTPEERQVRYTVRPPEDVDTIAHVNECYELIRHNFR